MSDHKGEFRVTVDSPHGKQPVTQFQHWLSKVADEAQARWNIDIMVQRIEDADTPDNGGFNE